MGILLAWGVSVEIRSMNAENAPGMIRQNSSEPEIAAIITADTR
jgi:hypothetical protein